MGQIISAQAFKHYQAALADLEKLTIRYPSSQLAVQLISGQAKIGPYTLPELQQAVRQQEEAMAATARATIELLGAALDMFRLEVGRYPTTQEGLEALRQRPPGVDHWDGPYLKKEIPQDPWGNPYVYLSPGERGPYDLKSYGADWIAD